jgi:hydroxymethylbilane synthase
MTGARRRLRIATRSSAQARTQAEVVAQALEATDEDVAAELVFVETLGDQRQDVPLHTIGGQGVFVKEVQRAVLRGDADLAVHSAKDLPSEQAEGLLIGAFTERRDARDALIGSTLDGLALGATVATGSVRRRAQLHALRSDLEFVELRGNIHTRLGKVPPNGAIVMAVAALQVLDLTDRISETLDVQTMVPAVGQGCVAVEARVDDAETLAALARIDHGATRHSVEAERAFLAELGSGCSLPVGAHVADGWLHAFLADEHVRSVSTSVRLGHVWTVTAAAAARSMLAEIAP